MVGSNLSLDDLRSCFKTTACVIKGVLNLAYIQRPLFEMSKEQIKVVKCQKSIKNSK